MLFIIPSILHYLNTKISSVIKSLNNKNNTLAHHGNKCYFYNILQIYS